MKFASRYVMGTTTNDRIRGLRAPWAGSLALSLLLAAAVPAIVEAQVATFAEEVVYRVNQHRDANGRAPLKSHPSLTSAAVTHSTNMGQRNFFSHCDLDTGTQPSNRTSAAGYPGSFIGENIVAGTTTPAAAVSQWIGSPGHLANILNTGFRETGVGYFLDSGDSGNVRLDLDSNCVAESSNNGPYFHYWTQVFGSRSGLLGGTNLYPVVINLEAATTATQNVDLYVYGAGFATEMRLRNEIGAFTAWQPYSTNVAWQLSPGGGTKSVTVEIRNGGGQVLSHSDSIFLEGENTTVFADSFESGNTCAWSSGC